MTMICIHTLGMARIDADRERVTPRSVKKFGLLFYLAAEHGRPAPRSTLCELLFPTASSSRASHALRELVYELRNRGFDIQSEADSLALRASDVTCDWMMVTQNGRVDASTLRAAMGGILPGYGPALSETFTEWFDSLKATLISDLVGAFLREIERCKADGDWSKAELAARACLAIDPLNGRATAALAQTLVLSGSATQAARVLDAYNEQIGEDTKQLAVSVAALRKRISELSNARLRVRADFAFAGRESEMALLSHAVSESRFRGPRGVLLAGEPGIGKSRIATELANRALLDGFAVIRANAHPNDKARPMGAFTEMVPQLLNQPGALGCSPESMQWLNRLVGRASASSDADTRLSNEETNHAIARAIHDVIGATSASRPLVMVVDDAQWVDDSSLRLLRDVVLARRNPGVFLLLLTRNERTPALADSWRDGFVSSTVGPLAREVVSTLVGSALRDIGEDDNSLAEWMVDISSGNPFYAESLIDHYRLTKERYSIPVALSSLVDQRIVSLSGESRDVLEAIVALGKYATLERIENTLAGYGPSLIRHLRDLGDARLIDGDSSVKPAHWLIAESVQRNAVPSSQRLLYRRIARVLEEEFDGHDYSGELWACAELWVAAGEPNRAAKVLFTCAQHAADIGRAREASDLYYRAAMLAGPADVERCAEESVRSAIVAVEPMLVLRAVPLLATRRVEQRHDDIELATLRARSLSDHNPDEDIERLVCCLDARDASVSHRLTAARAILGAYDQFGYNHIRPSVAQSIGTLLNETNGECESLRLICTVLYHMVLNHPDDLAKAASELENLAISATPLEATLMLRCAATGHLRCGERSRGLELWSQAHDIAMKFGLERAAVELKLTLASQYLDDGEVEKGRQWLASVPQADGRSDDHRMEYAYVTVAADFALHDDDRALLLSLSDRCAEMAADDVSLRIRRWRVAIRWIGAYARGDEIDVPRLVSELTCEHTAGQEIGDVGDFEMTVLLTILSACGREELAQNEYRKYLRVTRRAQSAVAYPLTRVAKRFPTL